MLTRLTLDDMGGGINFIDVGAREGLHPKWKPVERYINLIGFEPDKEECARLAGRNQTFNSVRYLPYALSGHTGRRTLYKTANGYCSSLLEPNLPWLERFSFADLFEIRGTEQVETFRLEDVAGVEEVDVDVMKIDAQGLDLEIVSNAGAALRKCFYVEIEPGFCENYVGEYTYSQVDAYMRSQGFILFDMNLHRVSRRNPLATVATGRGQILWCESLWLKDYIALAATGGLELSRAKALKVLLLCGLERCLDYGYELAEFFVKRGLLSEAELSELQQRESWVIRAQNEVSDRSASGLAATAIGLGLRLFPGRVRELVAREALKPHLLKPVLKKLRSSQS